MYHECYFSACWLLCLLISAWYKKECNYNCVEFQLIMWARVVWVEGEGDDAREMGGCHPHGLGWLRKQWGPVATKESGEESPQEWICSARGGSRDSRQPRCTRPSNVCMNNGPMMIIFPLSLRNAINFNPKKHSIPWNYSILIVWYYLPLLLRYLDLIPCSIGRR